MATAAYGLARLASTTAEGAFPHQRQGRACACSEVRTSPGKVRGAPAPDQSHELLQFFVRTEAGKTLTFRLGRDCTTEELRCHIHVRTGQRVEGTWLAYGGKPLQDTRSLADYGVRSGATLQQQGRLRGGMSSWGAPWRGHYSENAAHRAGPGGGAQAGGRPRWPADALRGNQAPAAPPAPPAPNPITDPWQEGTDPWGGGPARHRGPVPGSQPPATSPAGSPSQHHPGARQRTDATPAAAAASRTDRVPSTFTLSA